METKGIKISLKMAVTPFMTRKEGSEEGMKMRMGRREERETRGKGGEESEMNGKCSVVTSATQHYRPRNAGTQQQTRRSSVHLSPAVTRDDAEKN
jgi:hypothetical protein